MTDELITRLRDFNAWRQGDDTVAAPDPRAITAAIESACCGLEEHAALRTELAVLRAQVPVAWMHETRVDVIHESVRTLLKTLSEGAGPESLHRPIDKSERYTIPLYAAPVPAQPAVAVPAEVARSVQVLRAHNGWRRGNKTENWEPIPYSPAELGRAIDIVCDHATHTAKPDLLKRATDYAHDIVTWLHRDHYSENTRFEPFGDLLGLLSQIDNMICGWKEPAHVTGGIVDTLRKFNAWRKGEIHEWDVGTHSGPDPQEITKAIDDACALLAAQQQKEVK